MRSWQLADELRSLAWADAERLRKNPITCDIARQLYRAVGSIPANLAEGYSRSSGRDRARFFEYALGSAREARDWAFKARHVLGEVRTRETLMLLARIIRLLTTTVVNERARNGRAGSQFDA